MRWSVYVPWAVQRGYPRSWRQRFDRSRCARRAASRASSAATSLRGWWRRTLGTSHASDDERAAAGPIATFVARSKSLLRGIGIAVAFVALIAWSHPTALTVLVVGLLLVVYLVILELVGRNAAEDPATG